MLKNHFKISLRNLNRDRAFTFINLFGLSTSMAICLLIILFVYDHKQTDAHISERASIHRVLSSIKQPEKDTRRLYAYAPYQLKALVEAQGFAIYESATIKQISSTAQLDTKTIGFDGLAVTQNFVDFFEFSDQESELWLTNPNQIVVKRSFAEKFFGSDSNIIGAILDVEGVGPCRISGVIDKLPKSHIDFDVLVSLSSYGVPSQEESWTSDENRYVHYFKVDDNNHLGDISEYLASLKKTRSNLLRADHTFELQALSDINVGAIVRSDISTTVPWFVAMFLASIALIVIASASFNFVGLSLARALKKAKEVGVRKLIGASKKDILFQFLIEAQLLSFGSLVIAMGLLSFLVPAFNKLKILRDIDGAITLDFVTNANVYLLFITFSLILGLLAGLYPAVYLARFRSLVAVQGLKQGRKGSFYFLRRTLITMQFIFSLVFIMTTIAIIKQANSYLDAEYGFNTASIAFFEARGLDADNLREELMQQSGIGQITGVSSLPALEMGERTYVRQYDGAQEVSGDVFEADEYFLNTFSIELVAGSNFDAYSMVNRSDKVVVGEQLVEDMNLGTPQSAIGQEILLRNRMDQEERSKKTIIGVCKDFKHNFLMVGQDGLILSYEAKEHKYLVVKLAASSQSGSLSSIEVSLSKLDNVSSVEVKWYQAVLADAYDEFYDLVRIFSICSLIAIIIANLGQYGALAHMVNLRIKEIGIRKVLGSSLQNLVLLLSRPFLATLAIALAAGVTIGTLINDAWLSAIDNAVALSFDIVLLTIVIMIVSAILTLSWKIYYTCRSNPVDSLRAD